MISHARKTVFVHIPKTGGQSVESVFLADAGLSWKQRAELLLRHNDDPAKGPEKLAHLYASEYVGLGHLSAEQFKTYFSFAIVRHPFDRFLSEYRYRASARARRGLPVQRVDDVLDIEPSDEHSDLARHLVPQLRYITDGAGRCIVDHVIRFEAMQAEIAPLFQTIFGTSMPLPHKNQSTEGAQVSLSGPQKMRLADRYRTDFEAFGYDA